MSHSSANTTLKELGFPLDQVRLILDDKLDVAELRGMLRLRRAQLESELAASTARLAGVGARLRMIETEGHMNAEDIVVKPVDPVRLAEVTAVAKSYQTEHIGPVIQPLYPELFRRLEAAGIRPTGPAIAHYEPAKGESEDAVLVHAGIQVATEPTTDGELAVVDLPRIESAATIIHRGPMDDVERSMQVLARWIEDNGYRTHGYAREVYLDYCPDDPTDSVTELQIPIGLPGNEHPY